MPAEPQGLLGQAEFRTKGPLARQFGLPPFSVLDTKSGDWQSRRNLWKGLGIQSELGRDGALTYEGATAAQVKYAKDKPKAGRFAEEVTPKKMAGTSIFDPVLCEICYQWWCPPGGLILDPFAGGSVRGIVASVGGYRYAGIELRAEQVAANRAQLGPNTVGEFRPLWVQGDSAVQLKSPKVPWADFLFSCPPYGNLEPYSNHPADISNMTYEGFLRVYNEIIALACAKLTDNRFAAFVVGNYREPKTGRMINFVGDTIRAFEAAGLSFYNDLVLLNSVGTGAMRTNTNFVRGNRKVVKMHQNVLVFVKGDPAAAVKSFG